MKQEQTNQKSREGTKIRVVSAKLRAVIIARAQRMIENAEYLPLADLQREIREIGELLARHGMPGRRYTIACPASAAKALILSLLQIPDEQASIAADDTLSDVPAGYRINPAYRMGVRSRLTTACGYDQRVPVGNERLGLDFHRLLNDSRF